MNIFVLDKSPILSAKYHNDKHVSKMILESAQLLCTSYYFTNEIDNLDFKPYKLTHQTRVCVKWVNESLSNWLWLKEMALELNNEFKLRFDKGDKNHKSAELIMKMPPPKIKDVGLTDFVFDVKDEVQDKYKCYENVIDKFRYYYMDEKRYLANWKTEKPHWFI